MQVYVQKPLNCDDMYYTASSLRALCPHGYRVYAEWLGSVRGVVGLGDMI